MITPGKNSPGRDRDNEVFNIDRKSDERENAELFQFDKTGNLSVRYLRESYNAAKARASELNTNAGLSGNLRSHCQQTIRVYSALATLLYSTISISKADDLERFVRKRSLQVPNSLFDIDEWKPVLQIARNVRMGESGKYLDELGAFKSFMKLRLERLLSGARRVTNEYKRMKADTAKDLEGLKAHFDDLKYKVIPYLQQKVTKLEDDNYKLRRDNKVFRDAGIAKDVEINELTRSKTMREREHAAHVDRVKKESFEAIAFAKSKIETQQSAHESEVSALIRQHETRLEEMRESFDAQLSHSAATNRGVIDRLTSEKEWLQQTHASVLSNAEKVQQQFKSQCDSEISRLEKRYAEAKESANSRLASESSNTAQLLKSTEATYEAKLSSANAAREYETDMLRVKLEAMEKSLQETQERLDQSQQKSDHMSAKLLNGEAELISRRAEVHNLKDSLTTEQERHQTLKQSNSVEFDALRLQLEGLSTEKSVVVQENESLTTERDELLAAKDTLHKDISALTYKESTLRSEHNELKGVLSEMESEKCRLMSYYDEKCLQSDAQKKEMAAMLRDKEAVRQKQIVKEEENYQLMSDLEADKSRLMGYYDEKCLQSDSRKKQIQQLEAQIVHIRKEFTLKEQETYQLMNSMEADKSRLMGYYDEKCLQIGTYKKRLAALEKSIKQPQGLGDEEAQRKLQEDSLSFHKLMAERESAPVKTVNEKKDATELVSALSKAIAEYTVSSCVEDVISALHPPHGDDYVHFIANKYASSAGEISEDHVENIHALEQKIQEFECTVSKKNSEIHALIAVNEAKEAEVQQLKSAVIGLESAARQAEAEVSTLRSKVCDLEQAASEVDFVSTQYTPSPAAADVESFTNKINELTKENYYSTAKVAELTVELDQTKRELLESNKANGVDASKLESADADLQSMESRLQILETESQRSSRELLEKVALIDHIQSNNKRINQEKDATIESQEAKLSHLRKLVSDLKGSKDELESQLNEMKTDPTLNAKIEKLQAITRGFNARARVKRTKMHRDAKISGVLVATKHTTQGSSGWYCAPDGSLYYFVLDGDEWILTCGPITRDSFEETVQHLKPKAVSSPGYLKVSKFDLVTQSVDQPGHLYMSTSDWKLYFAVSVDHLVTENR